MSWFTSAPAEATPAEPKPLDRTELLKDIFRTMDTDGDGKVNIEEYKAVLKTKTWQNWFQVMDRRLIEADGKLSMSEWLLGLEEFNKDEDDTTYMAKIEEAIGQISSLPATDTRRLDKSNWDLLAAKKSASSEDKLVEEDLALMDKAVEGLEMKTSQMNSFMKLYGMFANSDAIAREGGPNADLIQGPHDRLARQLNSSLARRAKEVIDQPASSWAVELPADFEARKQKVADALQAAEELLTQVNSKYAKQVSGCGSDPTAEITLNSMSLTGKIVPLRLLPTDSLEIAKRKLQDREGIPPSQLNFFVEPRDKQLSTKIVHVTQIRGTSALLQEAQFRHVWDAMNTSSLKLWEEADTPASLGLHDGARMFHVLTLGGSPFATPLETAEQQKVAFAYIGKETKKMLKEMKQLDRGGGGGGGGGCCALM